MKGSAGSGHNPARWPPVRRLSAGSTGIGIMFPSWLFEDEESDNEPILDEEGNHVVSFKLFASIPVTYHNPGGKALYGVSPKSYKVTMSDGRVEDVDGPTIHSDLADTIRRMKALGIWVEVTTLIIPGHNDGEDDLEGIAGFLAEVGKDIPWHISRFHPDYQFDSTPPTPMATLEKAERIGHEAGLHFIYPGNVPVARHTLCPGCGAKAIVRSWGGVQRNNLREGRCSSCGEAVAGVWS